MSHIKPRTVADSVEPKPKSRTREKLAEAARNEAIRQGEPADRPLEEMIRTPATRGPLYWWTLGLLLLAAFVFALWIFNLFA